MCRKQLKINSRWRGENSPDSSPKNSPSEFNVDFDVLMWIYGGLLMKNVINGVKLVKIVINGVKVGVDV